MEIIDAEWAQARLREAHAVVRSLIPGVYAPSDDGRTCACWLSAETIRAAERFLADESGGRVETAVARLRAAQRTLARLADALNEASAAAEAEGRAAPVVVEHVSHLGGVLARHVGEALDALDPSLRPAGA